eukprot:1102714-Rhodomonas_salina.3
MSKRRIGKLSDLPVPTGAGGGATASKLDTRLQASARVVCNVRHWGEGRDGRTDGRTDGRRKFCRDVAIGQRMTCDLSGLGVGLDVALEAADHERLQQRVRRIHQPARRYVSTVCQPARRYVSTVCQPAPAATPGLVGH